MYGEEQQMPIKIMVKDNTQLKVDVRRLDGEIFKLEISVGLPEHYDNYNKRTLLLIMDGKDFNLVEATPTIRRN